MVSEMETVKSVTNAVNNSAYLANPSPQPMPAQSIGVEFVRQYYTMLNKAPHFLYRFYSEDSTFVHGCFDKHGDVVQYVRGQKQISGKISSLNFNNCHTKIRQVDSMETIGNGVVIQVAGELSNNGQPLRRFLQTFVLTPQSPNKYYVRNDIFRYHDEIFVEESDPPAEVDANAENHSESESFKQSDLTEKDYTYQSNGTINSTAATIDQESTVADEAIDIQEDEPDSVQENLTEVNTSLVDAHEEVKEDLEEEEEEEIEPSSDISHIMNTNQLMNEPKTKTYASMLRDKSFPAAGSAPVVAIQAKPAPIALAPVNPITNNDIAANVIEHSVTAQPSVVPKNAAVAVPAAAPTGFPPQRDRFIKKVNNFNRRNESRESPKNTDSNAGEAEATYFKGASKKIFPDDHQLFIGNLMPECTEDDLGNVFSKYGKIMEVRINSQIHKPNSNKAGRNYGFITFEDAAVVDQIIAQKPIFHGNHRYNVEKKQGRNNFREERPRNNQLNNASPRNGGNLPNPPNPSLRHGPMSSGGLGQGNPGQRSRGGFQNSANSGPGARNFGGGQNFPNRNSFGAGHPQNR